VPKRNHRQTTVRIVTLAVGAAGFVGSGAFDVGSQRSLGDNQIQVAGTNQTVSFSPLTLVARSNSSDDGTPGSKAATEDDANGGDEMAYDGMDAAANIDTDPGDDTSVSTSVEVPVGPAAANSLNSTGTAIWDGSLFETATLLGRLIDTCVEPVMVN
jgi:hypothetical protein